MSMLQPLLRSIAGSAVLLALLASSAAEAGRARTQASTPIPGPETPLEETAPRWDALDGPGREAVVDAWRAAGWTRMVAANAASLDSDDRDTYDCRATRVREARTFLDVLDRMEGALVDPAASSERRRAALGIVARAWQPVIALEAMTPCDAPDPHTGPEVAWRGPRGGMSELPEPMEDDPMSLGGDFTGRRALRR